jgi:hypothetical protein
VATLEIDQKKKIIVLIRNSNPSLENRARGRLKKSIELNPIIVKNTKEKPQNIFHLTTLFILSQFP